ncbi:MAG: DsbA family oxidoreductase [Gemmatimonadota bacterium]
MAGARTGHKHGALASRTGRREISVVNAREAHNREITVFADFVCPFSYLSALGLDRITTDRSDVQVRWRAFELRPPETAALAPLSDAEWEMVNELAHAADVKLQRPAHRPRTRKAHEAVKLAGTLGKGAAMQRAIFDAFFRDERDIGRIDVLVEIGTALEIEPAALKVALDVDAHTEDVLTDEQIAQQLEIEGTPAFVAGADVIVGYMSADHLRDWLKE